MMKFKKLILFLLVVILLLNILWIRAKAEDSNGKVSIIELFTATWCSFCPSAEEAVENAFNSANGKFILVEYHLGDPFATNDTVNRGYFYGITGTPTAVVNGEYKFIGSSRIKTIGISRAIEDAGKPTEADFSKLDAFISNGNVNVYISGKNNSKKPLNLIVLCVEDNIKYKNKTLRFVARQIKQFKENKESFNEDVSFKVQNNYNTNKLYIVAVLQNENTKKVYQAKEIKVLNTFESPQFTFQQSKISTFPFNINFTEVTSAEKYEIQFATDPLFRTVVKTETVKSPPYVIKRNKFISGKYFIRVRAVKGNIKSQWSNTATVQIQIIKTIVMKINSPFMTVNGKKTEIDPGRGTVPTIIPKWGRTVVPIRAVVESLGGDVQWDPLTKTITIILAKKQLPPAPPVYTIYISMQIGNPQATINGIKKWIDENNHKVSPIILNDRTMVPLRFVAESLGCTVQWDPESKTITISCEE